MFKFKYIKKSVSNSHEPSEHVWAVDKWHFSFLFLTIEMILFRILVVSLITSCFIFNQAITKEYAFAHFPHGNADITLQRPGKSEKWYPKIYKRKDRSTHMLGGQWSDFVRDNHVQEGDICVFLPTNGGRRFTFTVYLLCAIATHSRRGAGFQRVGPCPGGPSANMASEIHIKEEPTDGIVEKY